MQPASKLPCGCEHRRSPLSGNRPQASLKAGSWLIVAPLRSNDETSEQARTGER